MSLLDKVLEQIDFAELVGQRTNLKNTKGDNYKGLSPFTDENTPSFTLDNRAKVWYCFSSGQGGGVLDYVMKTETLDRDGAVYFLADYLGIEYEEVDDPLAAVRNALKLAMEYFKGYSHKAEDYVIQRGLDKAVVEEYDLGFCPDNDIVKYLKAKGINDETLLKSGLIYEDSGSCRFVGRVIIPIKDMYGRVVSFTGRDVLGVSKAKYLHGPVTELFQKKEIVWNLSHARTLISEQERVIVCEGQMDAIALSYEGIPAVAILGATISEQQLRTLSKVTSNIYIVFDSDDAGERGLLKAFEMASSLSVDAVIYAIVLDNGDPDDFIKENGKDAFEELIDSAKPDTAQLVQILIRENYKPERTKAAITQSVLQEAKKYMQEQFTYRSIDLIERLAQELGLSRKELQDWIKSGTRFAKNSSVYNKVYEISFPAPVYERRLLYAILDEPHRLSEYRNTGLSDMDFESQLVSKVIASLKPNLDSAEAFDVLKESLTEEEYYKVLSFYSQGILEVDFHTALDVMKSKVFARTKESPKNFLGRESTATEKELKSVVRDIMSYDKEPF